MYIVVYMNKKTVKLTEVTLIPGKKDSSKVDGVWAGNLNIRPSGNSFYCRMPKELGGICPKKITIELTEPMTFEALTSKKRRQQDTAKYVYAKAKGLLEDFSGSSQDDEIKLLDLMHLLGIPDERILGGCAPVFEDLKEKLQVLGARWYKHDAKWCEDNNKAFSLNGSAERFTKDSRTESKMKKAGLTDEQIADTEMIEAVMKKVIDEQFEPDMQSYSNAKIDEEHRKTQQKYKKAKRQHKSKDKPPRTGRVRIKAEKMTRKEQTPEEKREMAEEVKRLRREHGWDFDEEGRPRKIEGGDKHE